MERPTLRDYTSDDAAATLAVFRAAVRETASAFYSPEQIGAWVGGVDEAGWNQRRQERGTVVAVVDGEVAGFGDVDAAGYLDMLYVAPGFARRGVATALLRELEARAVALGAKRLSTSASLAARPLLERLGFTVEREQRPVRLGVELVNYAMVKPLPPG